MGMTPEQLAEVRAEIGDAAPPTDDDLHDAFDRLQDTAGIVREVLQKRLANLLGEPTSVSIPGIYSENNSAAIQAMQNQLARIQSKTPLKVNRLVRPNRTR